MELPQFLTEAFPELSQVPALCGVIVAAIGELLSFCVEPLKRRDRLGNPAARIILAIMLLICLIVLIFDLSGWWLLCCLLPLSYLPIRWYRLKRSFQKARAVRIQDRQQAIHCFINSLTSMALFEWEIRRFLLPLLTELRMHGSIHRLKEEMVKLKDYSDHFFYVQALQGVMEVEHRHQEMLDLLKAEILKAKDRNSEYYPMHINNLYHAAMTLDDSVGIRYAFSHIESYAAACAEDERKILPEMLDAMLYRYDVENDSAGVARVRGIISRRVPRTFDEYLQINDSIMIYNRRHENREEIIAYLDEAEEKAKTMISDEEQRLRFNLRMVTYYIEFDYKWREKTIAFFTDAEKYLSYSHSIAFEYMRMVLNTMKDAQMMRNLSLQDDRRDYLQRQILNLVGQYIDKHRRELFECDDELLYMKINAYRFLIDYAHLKAMVTDSIDDYVKEMLGYHRAIIELCRKNGELSELSHNLVTIIDDYLTAQSAIRYGIHIGNTSQNFTDALKIIEDNRRMIKEFHSELKALLARFGYDRLSAYQILWAANFCAIFGEIDDARFLLGKFEEHKIDIRNYRQHAQLTYHALRIYLNSAPVAPSAD